jgi:tetratricopeptide (TPR) repeat protein
VEAAEIDPRSVAAARGLARARQAQGDESGAEAAYLAAIESRPDDWLAVAYYGQYLASLGRDAEAVQQFERVTSLTPRNPVGWSSLGAVRLRVGEVDGAIEALRRSIAVRPTVAGWSNLAVLLKQEGRLAEAADAFRSALALNDRDFVVWANLAAVLKQAGAGEEEWGEPCRRALDLGNERLAINPNDPNVLSKVAQLESECGTPEAAIRNAEAAITASAGDVHVLVAAASALATAGDAHRACETLARAIEEGIDPALVRDDEGLPDLKQLDCYEEIILSRR